MGLQHCTIFVFVLRVFCEGGQFKSKSVQRRSNGWFTELGLFACVWLGESIKILLSTSGSIFFLESIILKRTECWLKLVGHWIFFSWIIEGFFSTKCNVAPNADKTEKLYVIWCANKSMWIVNCFSTRFNYSMFFAWFWENHVWGGRHAIFTLWFFSKTVKPWIVFGSDYFQSKQEDWLENKEKTWVKLDVCNMSICSTRFYNHSMVFTWFWKNHVWRGRHAIFTLSVFSITEWIPWSVFVSVIFIVSRKINTKMGKIQ